MSRLRRSIKGYIRSIQMSKSDLIVFVEGKESDSYFYGSICDTVCLPLGVTRQIRTAKELPVQAGGKKTLIEFYRVLKKNNALISKLNSKSTATVFLLDKDIDDILGIKCRSQHVIYTKYYDVQNHIFKDSNFINGVASAVSIDPEELRDHHLFSSAWCHTVATRWLEWVKLCVFVQKYKVSGVSNYRVCSMINTPLNGTLDTSKLASHKLLVQNNFIGSLTDINNKLKTINNKIDTLYKNKKHDVVFKGKWYATLIELDLKQEFAGRDLHFEKLSQRIVAILASSLDFTAEWANHFRLPLQNILSLL